MQDLIQRLRQQAATAREIAEPAAKGWQRCVEDWLAEERETGIDYTDVLYDIGRYAGHHANLALDLEAAADALERLTKAEREILGLIPAVVLDRYGEGYECAATHAHQIVYQAVLP